MKLLIDIDKEDFTLIRCVNSPNILLLTESRAMLAVKNGKPLDNMLDEIRAEIEPKCDRINSLASVLSYTAHREIQELLCEIMDLCKAESEEGESE